MNCLDTTSTNFDTIYLAKNRYVLSNMQSPLYIGIERCFEDIDYKILNNLNNHLNITDNPSFLRIIKRYSLVDLDNFRFNSEYHFCHEVNKNELLQTINNLSKNIDLSMSYISVFCNAYIEVSSYPDNYFESLRVYAPPKRAIPYYFKNDIEEISTTRLKSILINRVKNYLNNVRKNWWTNHLTKIDKEKSKFEG